MDIHTRIAAALHVVMGLLGAAFMLVAVFALDTISAQFQLPAFVFRIGTVFVVLLALLCLAEVGAGVALLRGAPAARVFVIVFGVLDLFQFPVGTAIGVYTLWALLRKQPVTGAQIVSP